MTDSHSYRNRRGDSLRESTAPPAATMIDNSAGQYPTDRWEVAYFSVNREGALDARRVAVCVPAGLNRVCARIPLGQPGCIYAVRRWGFALRPSALEAAGFEAIRRAQFNDSSDLRFKDVEDIKRWENCLGIECRKPL